jgi:hypothetical protein
MTDGMAVIQENCQKLRITTYNNGQTLITEIVIPLIQNIQLKTTFWLEI